MKFLKKIFNTSTPDKETFAQMVIDALHLQGIEGKIDYQPEGFCLRLPGGNTLFLANHYRAFCQAPVAQREGMPAAIAAEAAPPAVPDTFEDAKDRLRPAMATLTSLELDALALQAAGYPAPRHAYSPLAGEFVLTVVHDAAHGKERLIEDHLQRWGVSLDKALDVARSNLYQGSNQAFVQMGTGLYQSDWNDGFDGARILFPGLYRKLAVKGPLVAMIPNNNYLLLTGAQDETGLEQMADLAEAILDEEPHPLSADVLMADGLSWQPMALDKTIASHRKLIALQKKHLYNSYHRQTASLRTLHKEDEDIFIAALNAGEDDSGQIVTYTSWTQGVTAMLPKADLIVFVPDEAETFSVEWEKIESVMGKALIAQAMRPERYRVNSFPDKGQMDVLQNQ